MEAVKQNALAMQYSRVVECKKWFMLQCQRMELLLNSAPDIYKDDFSLLCNILKLSLTIVLPSNLPLQDWEMIQTALRTNGSILELVSEELRSSYEIVKIVVENNGRSLVFSSEDLRNNFTLRETAAQQLLEGHLTCYFHRHYMTKFHKIVLAKLLQNDWQQFALMLSSPIQHIPQELVST